MITVSELTRNFIMGEEKIQALKKLSFRIPHKQYLSITGKSGSGKSTLLYQLSLLDTPSQGEIIIDDLDISKLSDSAKVHFRLNNLGYIFQDYAILPMLTAKENVMLPLLMQKMSPTKAEKKALVSLDRVGLPDKANNLPSQMSGGQQQRVSIARSIVHEPKILFADEPTANLDSESSAVILDIFKQLHREGQTIVMVTHEPEYAKLTQRIIELSDGSIVKDYKNKLPGTKNR